MTDYTCLISTYNHKQQGQLFPFFMPHWNRLRKNNPTLDCAFIKGTDDSKGKRYHWKNSDQPIRKWWIKNRDTVKTDYVALLEWDTLVNCQLPDFPEEFDLVGKRMFVEPVHMKNYWQRKTMSDPTWHQDNWWWWPETPRLGLRDGERGYGLISMGCFFLRAWVMDAICKERWDGAYSRDIISELRLPSIAAAEGAKIGEINLPFVSHDSMIFTGEKAIYHPIKS